MGWFARLFSKKKEETEEIMFVIAGLGNPSAKYDKTRHNVGFDAIDALAEKYRIEWSEKKYNAICGKGIIEGQRVILMKPQTFMNLSGDAIAPMVNFYKLDPESDLIVFSDDVSLAPGNIRVRLKGSAGGHNGLKDIIAKTGTQNFTRIKIGVGEKPAEWDMADHVLARFSTEDRKKVEESFQDVIGAVELLLRDEPNEAMNRYNRKKQTEEA